MSFVYRSQQKEFRDIIQENFSDWNEKFNLKIEKIVYLPGKEMF